LRPKQNNILYELKIFKESKEKELLEEDFDEAEFISNLTRDV